ncbi:hypothetical protein BIU88_02595 [Chlorobaculum limnaeum]|uniref:Uncharacterized protein n=1 Tax=Chlorobaculum limnaeum TaxID=274537 RepID=A0A1D8D5I5_CHLLM|nr:hypothetical protein BIU88_02595 [Chlorobaculum limnaeum]
MCGAFGSIAKLEHGAPRLLQGCSQVSRRPACFDQLFGKLEWHHKTIKAESPLDWKLLAEIKETFQESELRFRVDVLDWNDITE